MIKLTFLRVHWFGAPDGKSWRILKYFLGTMLDTAPMSGVLV
jgi:hypothetical protein